MAKLGSFRIGGTIVFISRRRTLTRLQIRVSLQSWREEYPTMRRYTLLSVPARRLPTGITPELALRAWTVQARYDDRHSH